MQLLKKKLTAIHAWNPNVQAIEANLGYLHSKFRDCVAYIEKPCLENKNKCLSYQQTWVQSPEPTFLKKPGNGGVTCNPSAGEAEKGGPLGPAGQPAYFASPWPMRHPFSSKQSRQCLRNNTQSYLLAFAYMYTHTHAPHTQTRSHATHTHIHRHTHTPYITHIHTYKSIERR